MAGSRISVLGAGRSGLAAARFLLRRGANVFLSDSSTSDELDKQCSSIKHDKYDFELGGHSGRVFEKADVIIVSPGIQLDIPVIREARARHIEVTGELEFTSRFCENRIIAITGTNGKSTATSMVGEIFRAAGKPACVAGNIGVAFADVVDGLEPDETVILEVSSYQLETIETFHPWIGAVLNIQPDHLKRHKTMQEYTRCKMRINENQAGNDLLILNYNDGILKSAPRPECSHLWWFNNKGPVSNGAGVENDIMYQYTGGFRSEILECGGMQVPGAHNVENALAAISVAGFAGIPAKSIAEGLRGFKGLEHRLENAGTISGVTFVNDSKATNVDSLMVALRSFTKPVILIAGGEDKRSDLHAADDLLRQSVKKLVLLGEAAERMHDAWKDVVPEIEKAPDFESAVHWAFHIAQEGDTVLLSPACASFDMFSNFEERGRIFKEIVKALKPNIT